MVWHSVHHFTVFHHLSAFVTKKNLPVCRCFGFLLLDFAGFLLVTFRSQRVNLYTLHRNRLRGETFQSDIPSPVKSEKSLHRRWSWPLSTRQGSLWNLKTWIKTQIRTWCFRRVAQSIKDYQCLCSFLRPRNSQDLASSTAIPSMNISGKHTQKNTTLSLDVAPMQTISDFQMPPLNDVGPRHRLADGGWCDLSHVQAPGPLV